MTKEVIWEAIKEPLRLLVLAIIPIVLVYLGTIDTQWALVLIVILRFVDKLLHELGKAKENELLELGLTRF